MFVEVVVHGDKTVSFWLKQNEGVKLKTGILWIKIIYLIDQKQAKEIKYF